MNELRAYFKEKQGRSSEEITWCANSSRAWWEKETAHIFRIADEVGRNEFLFDLPWDMEQTCVPVIFNDKIDWSFMPGEDPEFIYQMNRNRYWICLGQAYAMSGNEEYAHTFVSQLISWLKENPVGEDTKNTTWRTIEAGIRGEYWIKAMGYFIDSPAVTDDVWDLFEKGLISHGDYLLACDVPFSEKSNWGVLENHGLFMIGAALKNHTRSKAYCETAIKRLIVQARVQIPEDGVHWEQSPMYHNEVLKCYLEVLRTAGQYRIALPQELRERVKKMAYANLYWARPNHFQPAGGDSDETDVRDLLTICACEFMDGTLKYGGYEHLDFEGIWDYGRMANEAYEKLEARAPEGTLFQLKDSGNWYLRSGFDESSDYLHFRCGSLGGGHGHFDKLHVDLSICGEDILIDSGRYTYVSCGMRYDLKGADAHNVPVVDQKEYTKCVGSWGVEGLTPPINQKAVQRGDYTLMQGGHLGYLKDGVFVNRKILAIGTKIFVIMDEFYGSGKHSFTQRYHFNTKGTLSLDGTRAEYAGEEVKASFETLSAVSGYSMKAECLSCEISKHYNQKEPGTCLDITLEGDAMASIISVIAGGRKEEQKALQIFRETVIAPVTGKEVEAKKAEALKIKYGEDTYLVIFSHVETGTDCEYIGACGYFGLGQVMAAKVEGEGMEDSLTVVCW